MLYIDNRRWLGKHFPEIAQVLKEAEEKKKTETVQVERSKEGSLTLKIKKNGRERYVHSKYNPKREVTRQLEKIDNTMTPILFVGVGLGYHIDQIIKKYPKRKIVIYEPNVEVFLQYIKRTDLRKNKNITAIAIGEKSYYALIQELGKSNYKKFILNVLNYYEREEPELVKDIVSVYLEVFKAKKDSISVDLAFQHRWVLNSINNFQKVYETPNILGDFKKKESAIKGKVAIIVSAGPSLNYEFENLKTIINEEKAYVLSVGSAINSLITHNIHPHGTFTYDPKSRNSRVIQIIKDKGIKNIPLIFGSSVGYETLKSYPGDMLHFITSQDTISQNFLRFSNGEELPVIEDASSVAIMALQVLLKLNFKKIILVGQNLGYTGDERHSKGIYYDNYHPNLSAKEKEKLIYTRDVTGKKIRTDLSMESMRKQMEFVIQNAPSDVTFINTTKSGAYIEGTVYTPLDELMREDWEKVDPALLFKSSFEYDSLFTINMFKKIDEERNKLDESIKNTFKSLQNIQRQLKIRNSKQIEQNLSLFDKRFAEIDNSLYYQSFLKPMLRVQHKELLGIVAKMRYEKDVFYKGYMIVNTFNEYLNQVYWLHKEITSYVEKMIDGILKD